LTDGDIAKNLLTQAASMKAQVDTLTAEMARLTEEAQGLDPSLKPAKKRGRPRKVAA
jgi:DNA anti-recombination protein RmuC